MTDRVKRIHKKLMDNYDNLSISIEKMELVTEALDANEGFSDTTKRARAYAHYLDNRTIFIEDDQLLVGYHAAKQFAMEYAPSSHAWPDEDFDKILETGISITSEDRAKLRSYDKFWKGKGRNYSEREVFYLDNEKLWDFRRRGVMTPAYPDKATGWGSQMMGGGWGLHYNPSLMCPDYELHLSSGFEVYLQEAKKRKDSLTFFSIDDIEKYEFLDATIIAFEAFLRHTDRYAALCEKLASEKKKSEPERSAELLIMARNCRNVPRYGAKNFYEALQFITFIWMHVAGGQIPLGRFDQMLWPYLKTDLESGAMTWEKAEELLQCLRLKIADYCYIQGTPAQREKWAGKARWNVIMLGGCDADGNDATNPLTYLFLDCAKDLKLTHPTLTIRVNENTPQELMVKALDVVRTGVGYPAFISEKEYIDYLVNVGHIDVREAREFMTNGCIDIALPGRSRQTGVPMTTAPIILDLAMNQGKDKKMNADIGVEVKAFEDCKTFEEFYQDCFYKELEHILDTGIQICFLRMYATREHAQDIIMDNLYHDALEVCKSIYWRKMKFETSIGVNFVGIVTCIDSLIAIKKVIFDDKYCTAAELNQAIDANWVGYEELRKRCIAAPKYGNNDDYADSIAERVWDDAKEIARRYKGAFGNDVLLSGVSITTHGPAGKLSRATPDGRFDGEVLTDGAASPAQGCDTNGPVSAMLSAMRIGKGWSTTLHNMKFDKMTLKTDADLEKLASLTITYLTHGGHHIQYNVVDQETLVDAREHPEKHMDLIVRVAGYSAFFTRLTPAMQTDVINRTVNTTL